MEQVFKVSVVPSSDRDPEDIGDLLDFTYESFTIENDNTIVIKINFENPTDISLTMFYDRLKISVDKSEFERAMIIVGTSKKMIEFPANETTIDTEILIPLQLPKEKEILEALDE